MILSDIIPGVSHLLVNGDPAAINDNWHTVLIHFLEVVLVVLASFVVPGL